MNWLVEHTISEVVYEARQVQSFENNPEMVTLYYRGEELAAWRVWVHRRLSLSKLPDGYHLERTPEQREINNQELRRSNILRSETYKWAYDRKEKSQHWCRIP